MNKILVANLLSSHSKKAASCGFNLQATTQGFASSQKHLHSGLLSVCGGCSKPQLSVSDTVLNQYSPSSQEV